jgi:RNA polymerase sigma-70 factor (ECF subfamily)
MAADSLPDEIQSDELIAGQIQRGQNELFGKLLERYQPKITRYTGRFLKDTDDRNDIVQETFIKAYRNIESFDVKRKFSSWLYRIAHNECINFLKKKKLEKIPFFDLDILFPHISREKHQEEVNAEQIKEMLDTSMGKLDIKYREPLLLYYIEGFDYKEIADILHIPIDTVGMRLTRGRKLLKKHYQDSLTD